MESQEFIPKYHTKPDSKSEWGRLYLYLLYFGESKTDTKLQSRKNRIQRIENNPLLNKLGIFDEPNFTLHDKNELKFKLYLYEELPLLNRNEKEIYIEVSSDTLKKYFETIIELYSSEKDEYVLQKYLNIRNDKVINIFFKAIDLNLIKFAKIILDEDKLILESKKGDLFKSQEKWLSYLFRFCILEYKNILEYFLFPDRNLILKNEMDENNHYFLSRVAIDSPTCYKAIMNGFAKNIITKVDNKKIKFEWSKMMIYSFFKEAGYTEWKNEICPFVLARGNKELNPNTANNTYNLSADKEKLIKDLFD